MTHYFAAFDARPLKGNRPSRGRSGSGLQRRSEVEGWLNASAWSPEHPLDMPVGPVVGRAIPYHPFVAYTSIKLFYSQATTIACSRGPAGWSVRICPLSARLTTIVWLRLPGGARLRRSYFSNTSEPLLVNFLISDWLSHCGEHSRFDLAFPLLRSSSHCSGPNEQTVLLPAFPWGLSD